MSGSVDANSVNESLIYTCDADTPNAHRQAEHKSLRAAASLGTRELEWVDIQDQDAETQRKILAEKNRAPLTRVRVSTENAIRQGLLPISPMRAVGDCRVNKYSVGRFFQRIVAWAVQKFSKQTLTVDGPYAQTLSEARRPQTPENSGCGNINMSPRRDGRMVFASDKELARLLGYGPGEKQGMAFAVVEQKSHRSNRPGDSLFGKRAPQLADIRQSDRRSTCYFLSNLAAVLSRPGGARRIQDIMKDNGDGTVTVRFVDKDVVVSKDRIVDRKGRDIFSSGAPWVRIMEKAFLAYQALKHLETREASQKGTSAELRDVDAHAFQKDELNRFDRNSPMVAQTALAHTLGNGIEDASQLNENGPDSERFQERWVEKSWSADDVFRGIKQTLDDGGAVYANVTQLKQWFNRVLPGHAYCILSVGVSSRPDRNGQVVTKEGYWVFDPYGESVGKADPNDVSADDGNITISQGTRGGNSRFFVTKKEAREIFHDITLVSPSHQESSMSDEPSTTVSSSDSLSDWIPGVSRYPNSVEQGPRA